MPMHEVRMAQFLVSTFITETNGRIITLDTLVRKISQFPEVGARVHYRRMNKHSFVAFSHSTTFHAIATCLVILLCMK